MAAHVRGMFRVLQRLGPFPAAGVPRSQPAVGGTASARTIVVGATMRDDPGGVFLNGGGPPEGILDAIFFPFSPRDV